MAMIWSTHSTHRILFIESLELNLITHIAAMKRGIALIAHGMKNPVVGAMVTTTLADAQRRARTLLAWHKNPHHLIAPIQ
jgi:hypothetical protein